MADLANISILRMVHFQNVEYILKNGVCSREHTQADPNYINIGHRQLITDRHIHPVPIDGAGNLGEYVPFYFAGHTPMLYLIMNGYQGVEQRPQKDIVFLISKVGKIKENGLEYVFTNMNAKIAIADFYNNDEDFDRLRWDIIHNRIWKNDENNPARQDYKQAEFLVRSHVPANCITALIVKTVRKKALFDQMISEMGLEIPVFIDNNCKLYY
ncbi:DUF4433 domain-containing protein [Reichenbachiella sp.]|uniref:type II toxin-antitoxin system toxin DNA ADP-ribosyl transferase DarT n=1 Tax=Reichenbachiella sp. TaxID=2184521 RepID=UPI0032972948